MMDYEIRERERLETAVGVLLIQNARAAGPPRNVIPRNCSISNRSALGCLHNNLLKTVWLGNFLPFPPVLSREKRKSLVETMLIPNVIRSKSRPWCCPTQRLVMSTNPLLRRQVSRDHCRRHYYDDAVGGKTITGGQYILLIVPSL